jgi:hypothetical protein
VRNRRPCASEWPRAGRAESAGRPRRPWWRGTQVRVASKRGGPVPPDRATSGTERRDPDHAGPRNTSRSPPGMVSTPLWTVRSGASFRSSPSRPNTAGAADHG